MSMEPAYGDLRGYSTLQFHWGGLIATPIAKEPWSLTHLVREALLGGTPGPTLCDIDRFDSALPGWSVGGGVSGPDIPVKACGACDKARDVSLPVHGLNARAFL